MLGFQVCATICGGVILILHRECVYTAKNMVEIRGKVVIVNEL